MKRKNNCKKCICIGFFLILEDIMTFRAIFFVEEEQLMVNVTIKI